MKRITFWPQAFLGLTFNWGVLLGWTAVRGSCDLRVVLPLYGAAICWTVLYDTIYAHQDKRDDVKVGVKSTALLFGDQTKLWLSGFAVGTIGLLQVAGHNAGLTGPFFWLTGAAAGHLAWQIYKVNLDVPSDCAAKFAANKWFGGLILVAILADGVYQQIPSK